MKYNVRMLSISMLFVSGFSTVGLFLLTPIFTRAAPGYLDPTFGVNGIVTTVFREGSSTKATAVAVQADGKIVVAGNDALEGEDKRIVLARYNLDGSPDASFGNGGIVLSKILYGQSFAYDIGVQADGKIVVVGSRVTQPLNNNDLVVIRFEADGSIDRTFGNNGTVIMDLGLSDRANSVAIQPDGKIVVAGGSGPSSSTRNFIVVRLNSDGSFDSSFDRDGAVSTPCGSVCRGASAMALQQDGKIVAAGISGSGSQAISGGTLIRYNFDGSLDLSFDVDGIMVTPIGGSLPSAFSAVAIQSDGKIVASLSGGFKIVRFNSDGSFDTTFNGMGFTYAFFGGDGEWVSSIAIQKNGKIVAAGPSSDLANSSLAVARFNQNGRLDPSFGDRGQVTTDIGDNYDLISDIAIQVNGRIVAAGSYRNNNSNPGFVVARYLGDQQTWFDFDGDGRSDTSVFRPLDGYWYQNRSTDGFSATQFGLSTDRLTPADYDGDGKTDIAVFRDGTWYWLNSSNGGFSALQFGMADDVPVPADYSGDGRSELAIFRRGEWWSLDLSNNQVRAIKFGIGRDSPVVADYDGDGKADQAVYRNGFWHLNRSSQGYAAFEFGLGGDRPLVGDYDGDGRSDLAVYRDGTWYLLGSQTGFTAFRFGLASDVPVPADYDGDGKIDAAVYRNGVWYQLKSGNGFTAQQFGSGNDKPIPAAYLP